MATEAAGTKPVVRYSLGIGGRMAIAVCALLAVLTAAGGVWRYIRIQNDLVQLEFIRLQATAASAAAQFVADIDGLQRDVEFLSEAPAVGGFARARQNAGIDPLNRLSERHWRRGISELFEARLRSTPEYSQIRVIDAADPGWELIRVERKGNEVRTVPDQQLQEKGDRPYFLQARQSPPGAIYLSRVELNEEHGRISEPRTPTLRAATSVLGRDGQPLAVVVINKDLRPRFSQMLSALSDHHTLYVFDENLNFLVHPDPARPFAFQAGAPFRVTQQFAGLRETLLSNSPAQAVVDDLLTGESTVASLTRVHPQPGMSSRSYGLLVTRSHADTIAPLTSRRWQLVAFNLLIVLVTSGTVLFLSRRVTRPLREITACVLRFGQGAKELNLPLGAGGEAGVLARAFDGMARDVRLHAEELEEEVAERRRAEEALRFSEQRLRLALGAARAGAWEWDLATDQTVWDDSVEAMAAIDPQVFSGSLASWLDLMHPEDVENVPEAKRRAVEDDQPYVVEFRVRGREGDWRHWMARGLLIRGDDGLPQKLVGITWDVTDAKQAQEKIQQYATELERKNREMEQFVYSVSHDLKSPLVTCKGFAGILREDLADGQTDAALDSVERVERATQHMSRLIEDLLQLSRVGRVSSKTETIAVTSLVKELVEELQGPEAPAVTVEVQPDMPVIAADPMAVSRLFQNLLGNAFRYGCSSPEPRISVGSVVSGEDVRFFVRDNGGGIPAEYQEKVFGLFQRLETNQEGTGIGLAIVSKIMEIHDGRVWVESTAGQGATFWLAFPSQVLSGVEPVFSRSSS